MSAARKKAWRKGHFSEWLAALWLLMHGYRVVAMRYRTRSGELDLVARKGDLAVIVEVKARARREQAIDAVTATSQRRIHAAADLWLSRQPDATSLSIRFDIIAICPWRLPVHYRDAF